LLRGAAGSELAAYEIHAGRSEVTRWAPRPFTIVERCGAAVDDPEGAMNARGNVVGTYLHGLFTDGALRRSLLCLLAELRGRPADARWGAPDADRYERLADIVGGALDMPAIAKLAGLPFPRAYPFRASGCCWPPSPSISPSASPRTAFILWRGSAALWRRDTAGSVGDPAEPCFSAAPASRSPSPRFRPSLARCFTRWARGSACWA